jgi:hypothetical protein
MTRRIPWVEGAWCGALGSKKGLLTVALVSMGGLGSTSALAQDAELLKKIERLEREMEALKAQVKAQAAAAPAAAPAPARTGPEVSFGGQYRINAYSADDDIPGQGRQTASRVRIRQNVDIKFSEQFKTHLQMELGHTTDNVTTTAGSNRATNLNVRHAVMDYTTAGGINIQAGIVPLGDYFGDILFSSDWNYNPVAASFLVPIGSGKLRAFGGTLNETVGPGGETVSKDDTTHYQVDYVLPIGQGSQLNAGVSYVTLTPDAGPAFRSKKNVNYGLGAQFGIGGGLGLNVYVAGSDTDREIFDPTGLRGTGKGRGGAVKVELTGKLGSGNFGLLATHASGKRDGNGFIPTMATVRTNGYWGYTGILTVQGPTDTGIDGDSVNISNNGYGLTSVQAKYAFPLTPDLTGYVAAGWFGNTEAPTGRSGDVGSDFLLMGTYRFNKFLALDFGAGYAKLKDSVSGYSNGIIGGAPFNQGLGVNRDKRAFFARLQAEF